MCTVVILRRPGHNWPLLIGANRDEMKDRPWDAPMRHWPDRPQTIAGIDEQAGGTWLGMNDDAVVACILNRYGTLGSHPDYRSRGELPLEALEHVDAQSAAESFADINPQAYRAFNMIVGDATTTWWISNDEEEIRVEEVPEGLSMISAHNLNDTTGSDRLRLHLPRFRSAPSPDPEEDDWMAWEALLSSPKSLVDARGAMQIETDFGFETVSSSLIALPEPMQDKVKPVWKFCSGKPENGKWFDVDLSRSAL